MCVYFYIEALFLPYVYRHRFLGIKDLRYKYIKKMRVRYSRKYLFKIDLKSARRAAAAGGQAEGEAGSSLTGE